MSPIFLAWPFGELENNAERWGLAHFKGWRTLLNCFCFLGPIVWTHPTTYPPSQYRNTPTTSQEWLLSSQDKSPHHFKEEQLWNTILTCKEIYIQTSKNDVCSSRSLSTHWLIPSPPSLPWSWQDSVPLALGWQSHFRVWPIVHLLTTPLDEERSDKRGDKMESTTQPERERGKPRCSHRTHFIKEVSQGCFYLWVVFLLNYQLLSVQSVSQAKVQLGSQIQTLFIFPSRAHFVFPTPRHQVIVSSTGSPELWYK